MKRRGPFANEGHLVVRVKASRQASVAFLAPTTAKEGENASLPCAEKSSQRLSLYSVSMMSLIGKFAGGLRVACSLIRTIAVAYGTRLLASI